MSNVEINKFHYRPNTDADELKGRYGPSVDRTVKESTPVVLVFGETIITNKELICGINLRYITKQDLIKLSGPNLSGKYLREVMGEPFVDERYEKFIEVFDNAYGEGYAKRILHESAPYRIDSRTPHGAWRTYVKQLAESGHIRIIESDKFIELATQLVHGDVTVQDLLQSIEADEMDVDIDEIEEIEPTEIPDVEPEIPDDIEPEIPDDAIEPEEEPEEEPEPIEIEPEDVPEFIQFTDDIPDDMIESEFESEPEDIEPEDPDVLEPEIPDDTIELEPKKSDINPETLDTIKQALADEEPESEFEEKPHVSLETLDAIKQALADDPKEEPELEPEPEFEEEFEEESDVSPETLNTIKQALDPALDKSVDESKTHLYKSIQHIITQTLNTDDSLNSLIEQTLHDNTYHWDVCMDDDLHESDQTIVDHIHQALCISKKSTPLPSRYGLHKPIIINNEEQ